MQGDVHQTGQLLRKHLGHARYRVRLEYTVLDQTKTAGALADEHRSIGQEREAPWVRQSFRDNHDTYLVLLRSVEREGPITERRPRYG